MLRTRIEEWCNVHGYDKMDNVAERKNKKGKVVWKRSDWEHVDDMYNLIYNDEEYYYTKDTFSELNKMWKRYELDVWNKDGSPKWDDEVLGEWELQYGPDPLMNAK